MVKNKENPTVTEKGAEGVKKVNVEKKVSGSENAENNAEPEEVNEASEKVDEPMAEVGDEAANGAENEETPGEKSEGKKDQDEKKSGKSKNKKFKNKKKKKQNQAAIKSEDKKPEASNGAKEGAKNDIAGLIFMCSSKTKQDCFRYHVFGLPKGQKDVVEKVSKGMKLFLYDYELRLMYGIYKAKGRGRLNIEPNAFRTAQRPFPAQVRFVIHRDCCPLPEDKFKVAIKDNYYGKNKKKFKFELNGQQVKTLCRLFRPIREDERRAPFENVQSFRRPNLSMPAREVTPPRSHLAMSAREIAPLYPSLSENPYALQATDPYRYPLPPRQPLPLYESIGKGPLLDFEYRGGAPQREPLHGGHQRERLLEGSTYLDRVQRGRMMEDPAFLNETRGYLPREANAYMRRDPVGRPDIYPYASGSSSLYRF